MILFAGCRISIINGDKLPEINMHRITDSYINIRRKLAKAAYNLILAWFEAARFTPADHQLPL